MLRRYRYITDDLNEFNSCHHCHFTMILMQEEFIRVLYWEKPGISLHINTQDPSMTKY
jgi:hypothetical protein